MHTPAFKDISRISGNNTVYSSVRGFCPIIVIGIIDEDTKMKAISTPNAPTPGGHYSQGMEAQGFVFVSGMLPTPSAAGSVTDDFDAQVASALQHCEQVLMAAGCALRDVVQCTAYIVGVNHWPAFNRVYSERFGSHKPARAVVPVPELRHGALVELQMIARKPG
jgi:2-iminobutanoate/2-iminopropanoate deaminase